MPENSLKYGKKQIRTENKLITKGNYRKKKNLEEENVTTHAFNHFFCDSSN